MLHSPSFKRVLRTLTWLRLKRAEERDPKEIINKADANRDMHHVIPNYLFHLRAF